MKIIAIKDIVRKDVPIYYRKLFTGVAVLDLSKGPKNYRIDFAIEYKPTGQKDISVTFLDDLDYPLLPLSKNLKQYIDVMESGGTLPD
ncbi:MAG: hypothetical protein LBD47_00875 [Treponema sp.]|jgi:hypothetical protein|nr:hypothetical protein [Treponema sp.]